MPRFALDDMGYYGLLLRLYSSLGQIFLGISNLARLSYFYFAETCAALEGKSRQVPKI